MNVDEIISRIRRGEDSVTQFKRQAVDVATIASFASKELPYRGLGTGVKRAIEVIPDIQFESDRDANWLKAIVRRENRSSDADSTEPAQNQPKTSPEPDQNPTRTRPEVLDGLSASCGLVYDAIERDNRITYRMMAEMLKLNKDTVNTAVQTLIDRQLIRRVGPKKGGRWEVISQ